MSNLEVIKPYDRLYTTDKNRIYMYSPRLSGKSTAMAQFLVYCCRKYPKRDILVARANYNALEDSLFQEILAVQEQIGLNGFFKAKTSPLRMETILGNSVLFKGIGGSDMSRTRGIKSINKFAVAIIDEAQQLKDEMQLQHAISTIMRNLMPNGKILIAGNPAEVKGHWWNQYCRARRGAMNCEFIDATYLDIASYLDDEVLQDIEIQRTYNPALYKFMYLGSLDELQGGAYAQFNRDKHYLTESQLAPLFAGERFEYVIFGTDGAVARDSTCICPIAIMSSGRAVVLERFIYNPSATGQILSTAQLMVYIKQYLSDLENKYQFNKQYVEKIFAVDCASADLIAQLRYELDDTFIVKAFTHKNPIRNNSVVNDAFAKGVLYIKNMGGQYLYHSGRTTQDDDLLIALESVVWKSYKLDPAIPNDTTDALTYGVNYYYENPDNLAFPERKKVYDTYILG